MTLPRVPAFVVKIGEALDRADTPDELDTTWTLEGCDYVRGVSGVYLRSIYRSVRERHQRQARALDLARAI